MIAAASLAASFLLLAGQSFVSALPGEMKTVLRAEVWADEAKVYIENRSGVDWRRCRVTLNDTYELSLEQVSAGEVLDLSVGRFASAGGRSFSPGLEPVYDLFIDCRRAPETRGIALYQAPGRLRMMVVEAQERLARLGYRPGPADGQLGPRTQAAIKAFQEAGGEPPTGQLDAALLRRLRAAGD